MAKVSSVDRQGYWRKVLERQRDSGQSIVGFCIKERLSPASFHAWKRRLGRFLSETWKANVRPALVPVQIVNDPATSEENLKVQWPGGVVLRVRGCDAQTIGTVVAVLSASSKRGTRRC